MQEAEIMMILIESLTTDGPQCFSSLFWEQMQSIY